MPSFNNPVTQNPAWLPILQPTSATQATPNARRNAPSSPQIGGPNAPSFTSNFPAQRQSRAQAQQTVTATRGPLDFDDPWNEFWLPVLMGAKPGQVMLSRLESQHAAAMKQANTQTHMLGEIVKYAIGAKNPNVLAPLMPMLATVFGEGSAMAAAQLADPGNPLHAILDQAQLSGAVEPPPEPPAEDASLSSSQWGETYGTSPTRPGAEPVMPARAAATSAVGDIAQALRQEDVSQNVGQQRRREAQMRKFLDERVSVTYDTNGNPTYSVSKKPLPTKERMMLEHLAKLDPGERQKVVQDMMHKEQGITYEKVTDPRTGKTKTVALDVLGTPLKESDLGQTALSQTEKLAQKTSEAQIPSEPSEIAFERYKTRVASRNIAPRDYQGYLKLQADLDQAASRAMPRQTVSDDPTKGIILEALDPTQKKRRLDNWLTFLRVEAGQYSLSELVGKTAEIMSALDFTGDEVDSTGVAITADRVIQDVVSWYTRQFGTGAANAANAAPAQ